MGSFPNWYGAKSSWMKKIPYLGSGEHFQKQEGSSYSANSRTRTLAERFQARRSQAHGIEYSRTEYQYALNLCKTVGCDAVLVVARLKPEVHYEENFNLA